MSEPTTEAKRTLAWWTESRYSITDLQKAYAEGQAEARRDTVAAIRARVATKWPTALRDDEHVCLRDITALLDDLAGDAPETKP